MKLRKSTLWLVLVLFVLASGVALAGDTRNIGLRGFLPGSVGDSVTFQVADRGAEDDTTGCVVFNAAAGGEFVKKLRLPDDFWVYKVHLCLAASTVATTGDVTIKIYGPDPAATGNTVVLFEDTIARADLAECNEVTVFDAAADPPDSPITPANGPLYLSIGLAGGGSVYIKSVSVEAFSAEPVEIVGCSTGIVDRVLDDGRLLSEVVDEIFAGCENGPPVVKNHGQFVKCVSRALNDLRKNGDITGKEKGRIQKCAARSKIGK